MVKITPKFLLEIITYESHLNTDVQAGLELGTLRSRERCLNRSATAPKLYDT